MSVMYIRDKNGNLVPVPSLKGKDGKSAYAYAQDGGYTGTEAQFTQAMGKIPETISLGIASDGLIYIFINGEPVGTGIPQGTGGETGDLFGYIDENNTVVLKGDLADGTYNIKYEMEDGEIVNIGSLVLDTNVYYSITSTLANCTISNSTKTIAKGESYSATITANSGYELKSVTATMGGTSVTVTNGEINIASVTGNIVITAVAEEKAVTPTYTNLLPLSVDADGNDYVGDNGEDGYNTGYKLSSSKGTESATSGACVSGYIPITNIYDIIRIKNITVSSAASINNITFHKADKSRFYGVAGPAETLFASNITADANGVYRFTPGKWLSATTGADLGFFRFSCGDITDETIVTVNEEIA